MPDTAAAVQIPAAGTYRIDPAASSLTFATRHMFGLGAVKGSFRLVSGEITIADPTIIARSRPARYTGIRAKL